MGARSNNGWHDQVYLVFDDPVYSGLNEGDDDTSSTSYAFIYIVMALV
jgi:hypothetical protein